MKVYFICYPHGPADKAGNEHHVVVIAEGLKEQGIEPLGNVNYWLNSPNDDEYLIKEYQPESLDEFDVVVFTSSIINYKREDLLPKNLFSSNRKYKLILIDSSDGLITSGFDKRFKDVDFILRSHCCSKYTYPKNFVTWQFGPSNRIIQYASKNLKPFYERDKVILSNFRVQHHLRDLIEKMSQKYFYPIFRKNAVVDKMNPEELSEIDHLYWKQTGKRHYPSYYERLGRSLISNAVGGTVQSKIINGDSTFYKILGRINGMLNLIPYDRIYQFDSWRFWESLVSGCCTMHLDFELYGMQLPEMPVNGVHYIGIDLKNPTKTQDILKDINQLEQIAQNGRKWAMEHYSPLAVSKRFLRIIASD